VVRALFAVCALWLVAHELRVVLTDASGGVLFSRAAHDVVIVVAGLLCLAAVPRAAPGERLGVACIGAGVLSWAFGEMFYTAVLWDDESPPIPSPADIGYLLFPPLMLAGLVLLQRCRARDVPGTLWVDGVTAALAVGAVCAMLVFETAFQYAGGAPVAVATALAYPLLDLVLMAAIVGALAGAGWQLDRRWVMLGLGVLTFWLADSLYLVAVNNGTYASGGWYDSGWWIGLLLIAAAMWQPPSARIRARPDAMRLIVVPLTFGAIGLVLLVFAALRDINALAIGLAALSLVAVMARLMLTFRENVAMLRTSQDEALTDALTGLGNRRSLALALEQRMPNATDGDPLVLVLFDLDGFKNYNDTFGHPAGDALLVRLGTNLSTYLSDRGLTFRMGGDEFCALFRPGAEVAEPIISAAAAALSEHGEGFAIGCSWGAIVLPREAQDAAEALRVADQRMYVHKQAGRASAGRQSAAVLLRALAERHPQLGVHLGGVAALADGTARRLGLTYEEIQRVRHAAELHDIGKVAIPDPILTKPGELDPDEWAFVRRHTIIGERIVAAAPSLEHIAKLVRSTHERWDGFGYPDGLAGQGIPLGARIVAVCDAFDAMTSERPYSAAMEPQAALDELRRCAASQFDPVVVEAFCAVYANQPVPAPAP
jgi:diguanylate cyclase (GGDEF)-like protein